MMVIMHAIIDGIPPTIGRAQSETLICGSSLSDPCLADIFSVFFVLYLYTYFHSQLRKVLILLIRCPQ